MGVKLAYLTTEVNRDSFVIGMFDSLHPFVDLRKSLLCFHHHGPWLEGVSGALMSLSDGNSSTSKTSNLGYGVVIRGSVEQIIGGWSMYQQYIRFSDFVYCLTAK